MKQYTVHRSTQCATGEHVEIDPVTSAETTVNCTCPALVVLASGPPGPVEPHLMQWSRGELGRLVAEFDRGHFDADGSPPRRQSMFISAFQSELLDLIDRNPFAAVVTLLSRMPVDQVTFCAESGELAFRMMPGQWAVFVLPDSDGDVAYRSAREAPGTAPAVLWERATPDDQATELYIRGQVRELLTGPGGWKPALPAAELHDDGEAIHEVVLAQLAEFAAELDAVPLPVEPAPGRARPRAKTKTPGAKKRLPAKPKKEGPAV